MRRGWTANNTATKGVIMNKPLNDLRELMQERCIDAYLVPASDFHQSEYFGPYFECTRFLSGFTGESCTLVITREEAMLWTDGRFFVQAEAQMDPAFTLCRLGVRGVPSPEQYLAEHLPEGGKLGFDGRLISTLTMKTYEKKLSEKKISFHYSEDLVGLVWPDRPPIAPAPAWLLGTEFTGKTAAEKLSDVRAAMKKKKADAHIIAAMDDIAWLFNIRGGDIPITPAAFAYAVITQDTAEIFLYEEAVNDEIRKAMAACGTVIRPYDAILASAAALPEGSAVLLNERTVSMAVTAALPEGCTVIDDLNPSTIMKAVKNPVEIENIRKTHVKDGVAMVRFMMWLEQHIGKEEITEISASDVLEGFRREQDGFVALAFNTISAYGPHGAMMHYISTPETNVRLDPKGFLLVDSGGHYMAGTTDITRTFVLGEITQEMKQYFTAVVRGMLNLASAKFLAGCAGFSLDILARQPMWDLGIDYRCGTGHGVGYLLNVHEGPHSFYFKHRRPYDSTELEPGMVITDEPGIYLDYRYGIRTENELLVVADEANEYGQFLRFEHITYCPIDLRAIDTSYMSEKEVQLLNSYHKMVYETLKDHLKPAEAEWLKHATREVK